MTKYTIAFLFALFTLNFKYQCIKGELADNLPVEGSEYRCDSCECPAVHDSDSSNFKRELNHLKTDLDSCTLSLESNINITTQLNLCRANVTTCQAELSGWKGQIATIQSDLQSCESKQIKSDEIHGKTLQECEAAKVVLLNDVHELQSKTNLLIPKIEKLEERERSFAISEGSSQAATSKCQLNLVESETNYNGALQSLKNAEDKLNIMELKQERKLKSLKDEKASLTSETARQKRQLKQSREKELDLKHKISELESEMLKLRRAAQSTYLNSTLIIQDVATFVSRRYDNLISSDGFSTVSSKVSPTYHYLKSKVTLMKKYYKKQFIPRTSKVMKNVVNAIPQLQEPAENVLLFTESMRLSFVSLVKQSSKIGSNYIELKKGEKTGNEVENVLEKFFAYCNKNASDIVHWATLFTFVLICLQTVIKPLLRMIINLLCFPWKRSTRK